MSRLLCAGFTRLWKARVFHVGIIFMAVCSVFFSVMQYCISVKNNYKVPLEGIFFYYIILICFALPVFCSLFLGTEYSDGTIRNKLIVGHKRIWIYLSNLILCMTAAVLMQLSYILVTFAIGLPLFGGFSMGAGQYLYLIGAVLLMSFAFVAIYTTVAMLCQNKALTAIICTLGMFVLFFAATYINSSLNEPEIYEGYTYTDNSGTFIEETGPNPYYIGGTKRQVYEFLLDFNPAGQMVELTMLNVARPEPSDCIFGSSAAGLDTGRNCCI